MAKQLRMAVADAQQQFRVTACVRQNTFTRRSHGVLNCKIICQHSNVLLESSFPPTY